MVKRRKVAIIYGYNENWIGGTYYIQNLIAALNTLEDSEKPGIVVICESDIHFISLKEITKYKYIEHRYHKRKLRFIERFINKASRILQGKDIFLNRRKGVFDDIEILFPVWDDNEFSDCRKKLYWIPDFQEQYLPQFFKEEDLNNRKRIHLKIIETGKFILFSSKAALNDFLKFYPHNDLKKFVLPFAVTHPKLLNNIDIDINLKYDLSNKYFICSNQFWKHKNHTTVIEAIAHLKRNGIEIYVVFTGKEHDGRNPNYFGELKNLIKELGIEANIKFLGFIDRLDQLLLMKTSLAVIQPSFFEGWSTVIEDAKSLSVKIIASNINVHLEQLQNYDKKLLFSPDNFLQLAKLLTENEFKNAALSSYDYKNEIKKYASTFVDILNDVRDG